MLNKDLLEEEANLNYIRAVGDKLNLLELGESN